MKTSIIKYKTIAFINGIKYLTENQINDIIHIICNNLNIQPTDKNSNAVKEGIQIYFDIQNSHIKI